MNTFNPVNIEHMIRSMSVKPLSCWAALIAICLIGSLNSYANDWTAVQGDVVEVHYQGNDAITSLHAFGKSWPFQRMNDGTLRGWIGVDLKQKEGDYSIIWQGKTKHREALHISPGSFRISRITVEKSMSHFDKKALARIEHDQQALMHSYTINVAGNPAIILHGKPVDGTISTPFGAQRYVNGEAKSPHAGLDIAAPRGTPIAAPLEGKVVLRESMFLNGNTLVIAHGNGLVSVYCHMDDFAVRQGDWVKTGQTIGHVGSTGRSTGPHLHWGIRFGMARVNPQSLLVQ